MHHDPFDTAAEYKSSGMFLGAMLASPVSLVKSASAPRGYLSEWTYSYTTGLAGCSLVVPLKVLLGGSGTTTNVSVDVRPLYMFYVSPADSKPQSDINCSIPAYSSGRSSGLVIKRAQYSFTGGGLCVSSASPVYIKTWSAADNGDFAGFPPTIGGILAGTFYSSAPTRDSQGVVIGGNTYGQVKSVDSVSGSPAITLTINAVI
jgi:hypothetical protein